MSHMLSIWTHLLARQSLRSCSLYMALPQGFKFCFFYTIDPQNGTLVARLHGGCTTSNFAWQVSGSIWITYGTNGDLGWLEVWNLENGLRILSFISIAYYINFDGLSLCPWRAKWAENWHVTTRWYPTAVVSLAHWQFWFLYFTSPPY